jgi:hypothetical protein
MRTTYEFLHGIVDDFTGMGALDEYTCARILDLFRLASLHGPL